jgi:phosphoglycerate dehydrogenase-like enzyme
MKIFVCITLSGPQLTRLKSSVVGAEIHYHPDTGPDGCRALAECDIAFGNPPATWLAETKKLHWIQLESVGFGEYTVLNWQDLGQRLSISNLAGFFSESVAESILAGILSHYRGVARLALLQDKNQWVGEALRPDLRTLHGAKVVLFGMGDINQRVAKLLAPFECSIVGFGRNWTAETLDAALSNADITICTVPHTPETRGLFDRTRINKLKPGSLFVNAGRGSLVDEGALTDALESGALGGAVIDVTKDEPLPAGHRFWDCRNLLLTQHTGGGSSDEVDRKIDVFLANLGRLERGERPECLVDFHRGY